MAKLVIALVLSNIAMTFAWFLHTNYPQLTTWQAIGISWLIAGVEYAIAIPAIRAATEAGITLPSIKILQEAITLLVFAVITTLFLSAKIDLRFFIAGVLVCLAVAVMTVPWPGQSSDESNPHPAAETAAGAGPAEHS